MAALAERNEAKMVAIVEQNRLTFSANVSSFDLNDSNLPQFKASLTRKTP